MTIEALKKASERIMSKVALNKTTGCLEWVVPLKPGGRPNIEVQGKMCQAHRVVFLAHTNTEHTPLLVCHKCNNILCVNPDHLYFGTHRDNLVDSIKDGLRDYSKTSGPKNGRSKLSKNIVLRIRKVYVYKKYSTCRLAREYGVSSTTISRILERKIWKHV